MQERSIIVSAKSKASSAMIFLLCVFLCLSMAGCATGISENDFVLMQTDTMKNLKQLAENTEDVYSLYIARAMASEDFSASLKLLDAQREICVKKYNQAKQENPIAPGKSSWASAKAVSCLENVFDGFQKLYAQSVQQDGTPLEPEKMSYLYLARQETINENVIGFYVAKNWIQEAKKDGSKTESEDDQ